MKHFGKIALLGAVLAASASSAFAFPLTGGLTVNGIGTMQDTFTPTSITFQAINPNATVSGATGNLAGFIGDSALMTSFNSSSTNTVILAVNSPQHLTFELLTVASFVDSLSPVGGASLNVSGTGQFMDTAGDTTAVGTFLLTSNGVSCTSTTCNNGNIGFSFTPAASQVTPEPNSLMLLGTGLVGAAGMLFRRRRATV